MTLNVIVYDENLLAISLNINELLELHNTATRPIGSTNYVNLNCKIKKRTCDHKV